MANPVVVTPAASEPLTLDEVKLHLRIELDNMDDDAYLWELLKAARARCESFLHRKLVKQTVDYFIDAFPAKDFIELPGGQLQSITSLTYTNSAGTSAVFPNTDYFAVTTIEPGWLHLGYEKTWPTATLRPKNAIAIRYITGYESGDVIHEDIRSGLLMFIGHLYENREDVLTMPGIVSVKLPQASEYLWEPYKIHAF